MVVLMHKAHYFVRRVTKDLGESSEGTRYLPSNTGVQVSDYRKALFMVQ
jgi:hypothetical protein